MIAERIAWVAADPAERLVHVDVTSANSPLCTFLHRPTMCFTGHNPAQARFVLQPT